MTGRVFIAQAFYLCLADFLRLALLSACIFLLYICVCLRVYVFVCVCVCVLLYVIAVPVLTASLHTVLLNCYKHIPTYLETCSWVILYNIPYNILIYFQAYWFGYAIIHMMITQKFSLGFNFNLILAIRGKKTEKLS